MELEFSKVASRYEAEFEATDNFNLHIEREAKGDVQIFQKAKDTEQAALISHATDLADQADSGAVRANSRLDSLDLLVRELELRLDAYGDRITALENQ